MAGERAKGMSRLFLIAGVVLIVLALVAARWVSAVLLAVGAVALFAWLVLRRRTLVLPGALAYRNAPKAATLVSHRHRLSGRPDYVIRERRGLVPVEVKSRTLGPNSRPYDSERPPVLAYCLLVEDVLGGRERREIVTLLMQIEATREPHRSHQHAARCWSRGYRLRCSEALA